MIKYYVSKRFKGPQGHLTKSQIRYLKLFGLYLFNSIKLQSVLGTKLVFNDEYSIEELIGLRLDFDRTASFFWEFFWMLSEFSLEEILPSRKIQVLWPLYNPNDEFDQKEFKSKWKIKVKLYHTNLQEDAHITIIDREELKNFTIKSKGTPFGDHRKNPKISGDFGIVIKTKKKTYTLWMNTL